MRSRIFFFFLIWAPLLVSVYRDSEQFREVDQAAAADPPGYLSAQERGRNDQKVGTVEHYITN